MTGRPWRAVLAILLLAASPACARPAGADPADAAEIRAARAAQNAQLAAGDLDRAAALWTEDVSVVAGLGRTLVGRAAYRAAFAGDSGMRYVRATDSVVVGARWPLASETGHWTGSRAGGGSIGGTYAAQWVRTSAGWRIRAELFTALSCRGTPCDWPATAH